MTRRPECSGSGARCLGSWWSSNASRGRGEPRTPSFRARTRWRRRAIFWFCWRCGFNTAQRVKRLAGRCGAECSESSRMAEAQRTDAGWRSQLGMWWAWGAWSRWLRRKLDGTGVTWLMSWSATASAWISLECDTSLTCSCPQFCWTLSVAYAVSLIRASSQKM